MELRWSLLVVSGLLFVSVEVDAAAKTSRDWNPVKEEKPHVVDDNDVDGYCSKLRLSAGKYRQHQKHHRNIPENEADTDVRPLYIRYIRLLFIL